MGRLQSRDNAFGALGRYAGFREPRDIWAEHARERLDDKYGGNPFQILKRAANYDTDPHLAQDYAAYWLLQKIDSTTLPSIEKQQDMWLRALSIRQTREFDWVHLELGWDTKALRLGEAANTVLIEQVGRYGTQDMPRLLAGITPAERHDYVNARNNYGYAAIHTVSLPQDLALLLKAGADLHSLMPFYPCESVKAVGTLAHKAVMAGNIALTAHLIALDRHLFTVPPGQTQLEYTPLETGQMYLESQLENYGRTHARNLLITAFAAMASKGDVMLATREEGPANETAAHYIRVARCINLAAYAIDMPMPYSEHSNVVEELRSYLAPKAHAPLVPQKKLH